MTKSKSKLIVAAIAAVFAELFEPALSGVVHAAPPQFTDTFVRPDTHKALTPTGVLVCARPSADSAVAVTGVEATVKITFPVDAGATDYIVNSTAANWIYDATAIPTGSTAWPLSGTNASNVTGKTVTFTTGDLTAGTLYCFHITGTSTLTNGSATSSINITGATLLTQNSAPTTINQTNWSTAVITDDTVTISAVVPPNFTITLSANTDQFTTNLDPQNIVATTGIDVSFITNAVGGWIAWVKSANEGLSSATANYTIDSGDKDPTLGQQQAAGNTAFSLVPGHEGYALDVSVTTDAPGGCVAAVDAAFDYTGGTSGGGYMDPIFRPIAACTGTTPATSDGDILHLFENATIRGGTPAGSDYTDILTIVGAGNF